MLLTAPWLFGGVTYSYRVYLAAVATLALAVAVIMGDRPVQTTRLGWILLGSLIFGGLTLLPLPTGLVKLISPNTAAWHEQAAEAMGESAPNFIPLTLNAANTRRDLALWGTGIVFYFMALTLVREPWNKEWVLWALAAMGTAYAIFAVVQQMHWNGYFYWRIAVTGGGEPFGAFYSRNQGAGYLLIPLACALGLLMPRLTNPALLRQSWGEVLGLVAMVAVLGAAIPISQSRGATLAAAIALLTVACVEGWRNRGRILPMLAAAAVILLCGYAISWLGQTDQVRDRLATLTTADSVRAEGRLRHWPVALRTFQQYPLVGTGQGAHGYAYRPLLDYDEHAWFVHAENQYIETLVHTGIVGGAILLLIVFYVLRSVRSAYREPGRPNQAVAAMSLGLVAGVAVHSSFDFFVYAPAVLWSVLFLLGLTDARVTQSPLPLRDLPGDGRTDIAGRPLTWRSYLLPIGLMIVAVWGVHESAGRAAIEQAMVRSVFQPTPDPEANRYENPQLPRNLEIDPLEDAIFDLQEALRRVPDDSEALFRLARCQINRYQLAIAGDLAAQNRGTNPEIWWPFTSTAFLHGRVAQLRREADAEALEKLRNSLPVVMYLEPAWENLKRAQRANPLHARTNAYLAELAPLLGSDLEVDGPLDNSKLVALAAEASPWNEDMQYRCGIIELQAKRIRSGLGYWRRSLQVDSRHREGMLQWLESASVNREDGGAEWYAALLPDNPHLKFTVATRKATPPKIANGLLQQAEQTLADRAPTPEGENLRADIHWRQGRRKQAITHQRAAIELAPDNFKWRTKLARWLITEGQDQAAAEQVRAGLRLSPYDGPLRDLAKKLGITSLD